MATKAKTENVFHKLTDGNKIKACKALRAALRELGAEEVNAVLTPGQDELLEALGRFIYWKKG